MERWVSRSDARQRDYAVPREFADVTSMRPRSLREDERSLSEIYEPHWRSSSTWRELPLHRMQLLQQRKDKVGVSKAAWNVRSYPERSRCPDCARLGRMAEERTRLDLSAGAACCAGLRVSGHCSGRIDVLELLSCADIRFFVEVVSEAGTSSGGSSRSCPNLTLDSVVKDLQLSAAQWTVEVTPPPALTITR